MVITRSRAELTNRFTFHFKVKSNEFRLCRQNKKNLKSEITSNDLFMTNLNFFLSSGSEQDGRGLKIEDP